MVEILQKTIIFLSSIISLQINTQYIKSMHNTS